MHGADSPPPGTAFVNFAYGSNMCTPRLRRRTPSARAIGVGRLAAHRLMWHKRGADGSAKCDIVASAAADDAVWGVLYRIDLGEKPLLDRAEGLGAGYELRELQVRCSVELVPALAYQATHIDASLLPFDWYHAFVVAGAREHGLPAAYLRRLQAQPVMADPDPQRRAVNLALLDAGRAAGGG